MPFTAPEPGHVGRDVAPDGADRRATAQRSPSAEDRA